MADLFSCEKQYVSPEQRREIVRELVQSLRNPIFLAGTAYHAIMTKAGIPLQRLRYAKDIDLFVPDTDEAQRILAPLGYEERFDKYAKGQTQRKKRVGEVELKTGKAIPAYLGIDLIGRPYFTKYCPEEKRNAVSEHLQETSDNSNMFGFPINVQGLESLLLSKLLSLNRAEGGYYLCKRRC